MDGDGERSVERRHLTVLSTDLVDLGDLAQRPDPENVLSLTIAYQKAVEEAAETFGGHVASVVGDAVLTYFGLPNASEDDAECAVRAAVYVHKALDDLSLARGMDMQCTAAIATGPVFVRNAERPGAGQVGAIFGETPDLADGLRNLAGPGDVVVSADAMQLLRDDFEFTEMETTESGCLDQPVVSYRLIREKALEKRLERGKHHQLVGRQAELTRLRAAWQAACSGQGSTFALIGEAGIGKSQLMQTLAQSDIVPPESVVVYQCARLQQSSSYYPLLLQLRRWVGVREGDSAEVRRRRIVEKLAPVLTEEQLRFVVALGLREKASGLSAEEMSEIRYRETLADAVLSMLRHLLEAGPKLLLFEDVHWADPSTSEIMNLFSQVAAQMKVLCVFSTRPNEDIVKSFDPCVTQLHLQPLNQSDARDMIIGCLDDTLADSVVVTEILDRANGVPLFIRACADSLVTRGADDLREVPASLWGLLLERLDDLGDLRDIALAAAAIGCPFDTDLLAVAADISNDLAGDAIERLQAAGILTPELTGRKGVFTYKHILQREVAYGCLMSEKRRATHQRIVDFVEDPECETPDWEPEFLAFHYQWAGLAKDASKLWVKAAQAAIARFAHEEVLSHTDKGALLLPEMAGKSAGRLEVDLYASRGAALRALEGFGAPASMEVTRKAFDLALAMGDLRILLHTGRALSVAHHVRAEYEDAVFYARAIEAEIGDDRFGHMIVRSLLAMPMIWQGRFRSAMDELDKADEFAARVARTPTDMSFQSQLLSLRGVTSAFLGDGDLALTLAAEGISVARKTDRPLVLASAMMMSCNAHQIILDDGVMDQAQALKQLAKEQRLPFYSASATSFIATGFYHEGEVERGLDLLNKGWKAFQATTSRANQVLVCRELARGYLMQGDVVAGLAAVEEGLDRAERYGEMNYLAEILRLKGELLEKDGAPVQQCLTTYDLAIATARGQGASLFERWAITRKIAAETRDKAALKQRLAQLSV